MNVFDESLPVQVEAAASVSEPSGAINIQDTFGPGQTKSGEFEEASVRIAADTVGAEDAPNQSTEDKPSSPLLANRYRLGKELARGGMGAVFRATDEQFGREIAVKLLLADPHTSPTLVRRFLHEAKITANLQHPGIPPAHDLGITSAGRPFLVMKLIEGRTLADWLRERRSPRDDRNRWLGVFKQISQTVGYAHSRNVIHRDLKPLNVMVGAFGEVQVMDWGLAKHRSQSDAEEFVAPLAQQRTDMTELGTVMGTPAYMAPEQARGENNALDSRTDVYALGVMLCEILTGELPHNAPDARRLLKLIAAGELGHLSRHLDENEVDPDLRNILFRCLALNPNDRPADGSVLAHLIAGYQSAVETRLQQAEAERARTETQLAEQQKRRRVWLGLAAVFLVGTALSTALAVRAQHLRTEADLARIAEANQAEKERRARIAESEQRILAENNEKAAQRATAAALEAEKTAKAERSRAVAAEADTGAFSRFLVNRILAACRPEGEDLGIGADIKMSDALVYAENRIDHIFRDRPKAEIKARLALAITWRDLGEYDKSERHLRKALELQTQLDGAEAPETLAVVQELGIVLSRTKKTAEAVKLLQRVLDLRATKLGDDDTDTLRVLSALANAHQLGNNHKESIKLYEQVRTLQEKKLGPTDPHVLVTLNDLGLAYHAARRHQEAIALFERLREIREATKPEGRDTLTTIKHLAAAYIDAKRVPEAVQLLEQVQAVQARKLGATHPDTLNTLNTLAIAYNRSGRRSDAIKLIEQVRDGAVKRLGMEHPAVLIVLSNLAELYRSAKRHNDALQLLDEIIPRSRNKYGSDHPETISYIRSWVDALEHVGDWNRAAKARLELIVVDRKRFKDDETKLANALDKLGHALLNADKPLDAEPYLRECLSLREKNHPRVWTTANARSMLGESLAGQGKFAEAEPLLNQSYRSLRQFDLSPLGVAGTARLSEAVDRLCSLYTAWGKPEQATKWRTERAKYPPAAAPMPKQIQP